VFSPVQPSPPSIRGPNDLELFALSCFAPRPLRGRRPFGLRSRLMARVSGLGAGRRNDWQTPPEIFAALGCRFDLDVAAPVTGPLHVPCRSWFHCDSLERPWWGFVWMNPPFGGRNGIRPWLGKFLEHGNGIALTPDRVSAPWFQEAWDRPDAILFTPKTPFLLPDGSKAGNPAFGNALWGCGEEAVSALVRAEASGFGKLHMPLARAA
jgi:hypothetical protein